MNTETHSGAQNERLLLYIPAKNEGETVAEVLMSARSALMSMNRPLSVDLLVIDDASTDNTKVEAERAGAKVISHKTSIGLGRVFKSAVAYAVEHNYDYLVTIDGDNQFDTNDIPALLEPLFTGNASFTSGNRFLKKDNDLTHMSKTKRIGNTLVTGIVNFILNEKYTDVSCGFRAYTRDALLHLNLIGGFTYTQEVFLNLGFKDVPITEVPVTVRYFPERKSRIARSIFKYGFHVFSLIIRSLIYYKPMKLFGTLTTLLWLFAIPTGAILGWRYFETGLISPYKAIGILSVIAFSFGIILLLVGVILFALSRQQLSLDHLLYHARKNQQRTQK